MPLAVLLSNAPNTGTSAALLWKFKGNPTTAFMPRSAAAALDPSCKLHPRKPALHFLGRSEVWVHFMVLMPASCILPLPLYSRIRPAQCQDPTVQNAVPVSVCRDIPATSVQVSCPHLPLQSSAGRREGGEEGIITEQLSSLSFSFPLPPHHHASAISLQSSAGLGAQWCQFSADNLGRGGGGKGKGKGVEHRQADASMSIPWALWFGGWIRGRVLLFCNRKAHFQKFQHTAKNLSVWSWNNVQLYPFENTETEMILVAKGLQSASLAGKPGPWEAGSTAGDTVGVSQCAAPQFIRSISNKLQVWVVNSKLILHRQFSYCSLLLGLCLWSHLDGLANLSPRVLKWQIFCLVFLSFHMWSLWSY